METALLRVTGNWGHFKKPETNNNPLTHDFITKTALIGLMGAVLGIDREHMRPLFPILSEDLRYGVELEARVWKQSWAFTLRRFDADKARLEPSMPAPRAFEFLRNPKFKIALALVNERSGDHFKRFVDLVRTQNAYFDPVLGLHNCPAEIQLISTGQAESTVGEFQTAGFVPRDNKPRPSAGVLFRAGFERLPSYQNDDHWNLPERYVEVVYMDFPTRPGPRPLLSGEGRHYRIRGDESEDAWCLI